MNQKEREGKGGLKPVERINLRSPAISPERLEAIYNNTGPRFTPLEKEKEEEEKKKEKIDSYRKY